MPVFLEFFELLLISSDQGQIPQNSEVTFVLLCWTVQSFLIVKQFHCCKGPFRHREEFPHAGLSFPHHGAIL